MSPLPPLSARLLQAAATAPSEPALGAGLILLIVFGILAIATCCLASGKGPVVRLTVVASTSLCYGLLALLLLLLPRESRSSGSSDLSLRTSYDMFLRILFFSVVRGRTGARRSVTRGRARGREGRGVCESCAAVHTARDADR